MAMALFLYLRYVEARGGQEVLQLLSEDGAFGCWSTEIRGYGKVSRDLLDSVNEILFLDRQLGVLGGRGLRVLDIGAGYGRLAHRMAAAIPSLADYCCIDAVPESTFLSEYYISFRGCAPPARVVPLSEFQASLAPGSFDLAVNIHSFSECTLAAIEWWVQQLRRLQVPYLFVVPNEADGIFSREIDGGYHDALPVLEASGYRPTVTERVINEPAVRDLVRINDNFYLFALDPNTE
jgi:SAM-dependent methyltransferase